MGLKNKIFHSIEEIEEHYFPKETERKKIEKMSPEEFGRYLARKSLEELEK